MKSTRMQVDWPEFLSIFPGSLSDVKTELKLIIKVQLFIWTMKSSIWKFHIWNFNSIYGIFFPYMEFWNSINGIFFPWKNLNFPGMPKTYPKGLGHAKFSLLVPWWVVYGLGNFFSTRLCMKSYISVSLVWPYILGKSGTLQQQLAANNANWFLLVIPFYGDWYHKIAL